MVSPGIRGTNGRLGALSPNVEADRALLVLLVHVAMADGGLDDQELSFLHRVLPARDPEELRAWALQVGAEPFDPRSLAPALPFVGDRWRALRFAARMAWKDGRFADEEQVLVASLAVALELPEIAVKRVTDELALRGRDRFGGEKLVRVLEKLAWDAVDWGVGAVTAPLRDCAPATATPVAWVGVDDSEQIGLFEEGMVAHFCEGDAWVAWRDLVSWTRQPTLAVSLRLDTEDGRVQTFADFRLAGLANFLSRILDAEPAPTPTSAPPRVEHLRGE